MILGFSTKLNGKETFFVEKIILGLLEKSIITYREAQIALNIPFPHTILVNPKLHTLRDDLKDRWHESIMIDYFINVRTKNMFRFAPRVPVVSTQEVFMTHYHSDIIQITIDDKELVSYAERLKFAINDGFDNWEDFFKFFYPKIKSAPEELYKPKLIHWTDLRY
ncbi:hypothetical protein [Flavobacterium psychrophilum]|uniref:hypothetical protein n=3 Tax=Flavobacteriales TaxID=200644 RepID=UPI000B7C4AF9|nr:hypothetical protein [Flavobacterium psychrophilum]SNA72029.1 conserved hypothetical protein [Flavobacterium psychrophilum]